MAVSFQQKKIFWLLGLILVSFLLGGYVDKIVDTQANYEGCKCDVYFLECHTFAASYVFQE